MSRAATLPYPGDQIIDATMARALHADACRDHAMVAWVVMWDLPAHPNRYAARLVTSGQAAWPYLLLADTLPASRRCCCLGWCGQSGRRVLTWMRRDPGLYSSSWE
jgi:hypothetical protein